jgi:hypothetical protein
LLHLIEWKEKQPSNKYKTLQNKTQNPTSMSGINLLPFTVVQKLSEAGIPQDSVIFYRNDRWVYQVGQLMPNTDQLCCQPIDSLGPFGKNSLK